MRSWSSGTARTKYAHLMRRLQATTRTIRLVERRVGERERGPS